MAGFAIFMWLAVLSLFVLASAGTCSLILYVFIRRRTKRIGEGVPLTAWKFFASSPFLAVLWLVTVLLMHVVISNRLAHQSVGFSPDPYVTLPHGYVLGSHNTYDGYIVAPGFSTDVPVAGPGYVRSWIDLQWSDPYFTGRQFDFQTSQVRRFVFDTRNRGFRVLGTSGSPAT